MPGAITADRPAVRTPAARGPACAQVHAGRRRVRVWISDTEWFLVAYAWPILEPDLGLGWKRLRAAVQIAAWVVFLVDYLARVWAARDRRGYFDRHLLDLLIVALPALRPLRLLRLVILFRVLNRKAAASLRGRVPLYVTVSATSLVICGALAVLDAERNAAGPTSSPLETRCGGQSSP